jgi:hypothetical protein
MENEFNEEWPKRITAHKVITYDTEIAYEQILEERKEDKDDTPVTFEDVVERILELAKVDFSCGWGHQADITDLIITDENGDDY